MTLNNVYLRDLRKRFEDTHDAKTVLENVPKPYRLIVTSSDCDHDLTEPDKWTLGNYSIFSPTLRDSADEIVIRTSGREKTVKSKSGDTDTSPRLIPGLREF